MLQQSFGASAPGFTASTSTIFFCLDHYNLRLVAGCIGVIYIATTLLTVHIVISPCVTSTTYPLALYVSPAIPLWGQSKSLVRVNQVLSVEIFALRVQELRLAWIHLSPLPFARVSGNLKSQKTTPVLELGARSK